MVSCPLAMTDGAAFTLRELKKEKSYWGEDLEEAWKHLLSNKGDGKDRFWTSGQWMTEKKGGSDVTSGTSTLAIEEDGAKTCSIYGYKWFSSATDSDMTLALARFPQNQKELEDNSGKLGLVFIKLRDKYGRLNNIEVVRLKDKLGTR
jgi:alkylation response protein AidB-like acyl-CoA dehydrogenase